jgi:7,8-dihydroneopterin aldolase/epimerase/oxygenase
MRKGVLNVIDFRVKANHGWYEEERILGGEYRVDVMICLNMDSMITDINQTVNYEAIIVLINKVMSETFKLIETAATALFEALEQRFTNMDSFSVTLTKLDVPINGLDSTSFTVSSS